MACCLLLAHHRVFLFLRRLADEGPMERFRFGVAEGEACRLEGCGSRRGVRDALTVMVEMVHDWRTRYRCSAFASECQKVKFVRIQGVCSGSIDDALRLSTDRVLSLMDESGAH